MERVTHRMPKQLVDGLESLVDAGHYPNRSEALRDGARALLNEHSQLEFERDTNEDSADKPIRTDGNGLAVDPEVERERRKERREQYETLNPSGQLLTSSELRAELPMLLARSNADGGRISSANGGEDTVTVELTYHVDGRLGVFGDGKTDLEAVRVVRLGNVYAALEPEDTVRNLFVKTGVPTHVPDTLADALECYAVVKSEHMGHYEPDPDEYVSYDLSDVDDGDDLETHLVSDLEQPVYTGGSDE
ncbi:ribbon-helix-helix domain-containing protein [Natronorubrum sp. FCH18a]|uniref:ribbon-helix-helix domain-containing protein n=1 Tax=Natronorubrum sp. FCH18a TaxID=3447018 RepID=UPI003F51909B